MNIARHRALPSYDGLPVTCYGCRDSGHIDQACPKRRGRGMVTSLSTPNTWAHVAAKGAHNRHGTVDNRIEVVPQSASHDQKPGVSPTVDDLKPTNAPLDIRGEQQEPTHQQRHDLTPQDEDANQVDFTTCTHPQEVITVDAEMTALDEANQTVCATPACKHTGRRRHQTGNGDRRRKNRRDWTTRTQCPRTTQPTLRMRNLKRTIRDKPHPEIK